MKFKILSFIFLSFFLTSSSVLAIENPFTINITKGTNKATINTTSSKTNINGFTSISKATGFPIKLCTSIFGSDGRTTPCEVTGLASPEKYFVVVTASDSGGNSYQGKDTFTLGNIPDPNPAPLPPAQSNDLVVTLTVQKNETEVKISIKNNTSFDQYKVTTTLSDINGTKKTHSGTFERKGEVITPIFTGLESKHSYSVVVAGSPVNGTTGYVTKSYTFQTSATKPAVIETATDNQAPSVDTPDNPNTPTQNTPYVPTPPVTVTTPGTILTAEQIAADKKGNGLVPCKDTCDFNDILQLVNNLITFLITTLFIPIVILLFVYAGYKYITAQGNPSKVADLKKMVWHIVVGMLLVLCSWLIVKTIISILSNDTDGVLQFLK